MVCDLQHDCFFNFFFLKRVFPLIWSVYVRGGGINTGGGGGAWVRRLAITFETWKCLVRHFKGPPVDLHTLGSKSRSPSSYVDVWVHNLFTYVTYYKVYVWVFLIFTYPLPSYCCLPKYNLSVHCSQPVRRELSFRLMKLVLAGLGKLRGWLLRH